jgi:hypothetical protein
MIGLVVIIVVDTSIVKVYDLVDKFLIPQQAKLVLFPLIHHCNFF